MHRSGTSALSKYLVDLGFSLPSPSLPPHHQDNPQGYWEASEVVQLNNRLLQSFAREWKDLNALPYNWQQSDIAKGFAVEIEKLLNNALEDNSKIVLKDPRLCRLLPLWMPVLQASFDHVATLIIVRRPNEVFHSLNRRSEIEEISGAAITDEKHALALWLRYNLEAEANSKDIAKLTFGYEHWLHDSELISATIRQFLTDNLPETRPGKVSASLIKPRHEESCDQVFESPTTAALNGIYDALTKGDNPHYVDNFINRLAIEIPEENQREADLPDISIVATAFLKHMTGPASQVRHTPGRSFISSLFKKQQRNAIVYVSEFPASKSHIYRVKNRVDALYGMGIQAVWFTPSDASKSISLLCTAKTVIFHRCEWSSALGKLYELCRKNRVPVGYDIDDYIFDADIIQSNWSHYIGNLPIAEQEVWRKKIENYKLGIKNADYTIGTSEPLIRQLKRFNDNTILIPNGFSAENLALASHWRNARPFPADGRKRIGYASGTPTHYADFVTIVNPVTDFLSNNPDWMLTIIGTLDVKHLKKQINPAQLELRPVVPHINLAYELARLDINLVPLEQNNPFCDAKSPLKWYEAALAGVPSVVAGNDLYTFLLDDWKDGLLACSAADWYQYITALSNNAALRNGLADNARRKCMSELNEEQAVIKLLNFIH